MMIRAADLPRIKTGEIDLAFRRWDRPRVVVGTALRTRVGLIEITSIEAIDPNDLTEDDARRAGMTSLADLTEWVGGQNDKSLFRIGLTYGGPDPRVALRDEIPDAAGISDIITRLDRLDKASPIGPWTRVTLDLIDRNPEVRAPELAATQGRETAKFKQDVRKLKELGLTESLDIGYRLSRRGEAVVDAESGTPRERAPRPTGTPLPSVGQAATRALRAANLTTLEAVAGVSEKHVADLRGVGPIALDRLRTALAEAGLSYAPDS